MDGRHATTWWSPGAVELCQGGRRAWTVAVAVCVLTAHSAAAADVESAARRLEAQLMAPCCFSQQVSVHHSPAAEDVRADIRQRLHAGQTGEAILQAYVEEYGPRILAEPPSDGSGRFLYLVPPLVFGLSAVLLWVTVRRFASPSMRAESTSDAQASTEPREYGARLDDQLRDFD